ncbi:hypothetical protein CU052_13335 [Vibrio harveyi]|uniref:recombinase RecT n=1 Tax=Vibrio harveyi TaxID=669 RepID=UPI000C7E6F54|nr:recombinase RecT [Vibrio harveyi]AWB00216.1 hypothetical protein CU052_13335 [Vibrio harveyi]
MGAMTTTNNAIVIDSVANAAKAFSVANLIFQPQAMQMIDQMADDMSKSKNMLPTCFQNDKGACRALIIDSCQKGMNPYAVGKHAFLSPNGTIGYEAKVFQAIAKAAGGIEFSEEWSEGWERVIGNTIEKTAQPKAPNQKPKKYRVPNWTAADEKGLYIDLTGTWQDGRTKTMRVYMAECHPRLSTNWANNPRMQTYYSAVKQFMRRHCPELIMGIFDAEDEHARSATKEMKDVNMAPEKEKDTPSSISELMGDSQQNENTQIEDATIADNSATVDQERATKEHDIASLMGSEQPESDLFDKFNAELNGVQNMEEYNGVAPRIKQAHDSGSLSNDEYAQLVGMCGTLYEAFKEEKEDGGQ